MHLSAAAGGRKIALVEQADRLSEEAANALLKAVEEPSPSATYLFIAEQQSRLPATLRSRLTAIPFGRVPGTSVESEHRAEAKALLKTLQNDPLGMQCAALEKLAHQLEAQDDPESAWRSFLMLLMEEWSGHHEAQPNEALRLGIGLTHAWQLAGTSLSPRLALEWSAVRPYLISERSLPSFLNPSYL
jgi:hypothetical protein